MDVMDDTLSVIKFQIGDTAWRASFKGVETYVICPDCGGEASIRCILHDGTEVRIECGNCRHGWSGANGLVNVYTRQWYATPVVITGVNIESGGIEYRVEPGYSENAGNLFPDEASAQIRAAEIAARADKEERDRIFHKEKDTKSWGWHVSYYRKMIRDAEKNIEHAKRCLDVAKLKAKQPVASA